MILIKPLRARPHISQRTSGSTASYIDVVDRIFDKRIVIEAWLWMSVGGLDLITLEAHVIVTSFDTYFRHWPTLGAAADMAGQSMVFEV